VSIQESIITLLYYALTTLSTVGYGDFMPMSIMERGIGVLVEIIGVTFFAILVNNFTEVTVSFLNDNSNNKTDELNLWFDLIKMIRNQPQGGSKDISLDLKERIDVHFRYLWDNDRANILIEK
jgi:hypothetical protein